MIWRLFLYFSYFMLALSAMIFINAAYEMAAEVRELDEYDRRNASRLRITGAALVIFSVTSMMFFTLAWRL